MSRLRGKFSYDELPKTFEFPETKVKYLKSYDTFVFYGYSVTLDDVCKIKVLKSDLYKMLDACEYYEVYVSEVEKELTKEKKCKEDIEKDEKKLLVDLDDDSYIDICLLQYCFCLSRGFLDKVSNRNSRGKWFVVPKRDLESYHNRGRKKGSGNVVDLERFEFNVGLRDSLIKKERFEEFIDFYREECIVKKVPFRRKDAIDKYRELRNTLRK